MIIQGVVLEDLIAQLKQDYDDKCIMNIPRVVRIMDEMLKTYVKIDGKMIEIEDKIS
jgi:hypothetical protein